MSKRKIPGLSFSWKRAVGISSAKQKVARSVGIPTTKSGRQKKWEDCLELNNKQFK